MAIIQCPHCQAINEDVGLDKPCRNCGTILGAPLSAIDTGKGAPTSAANKANAGGATDTSAQTPRDGVQPVGSAPVPKAVDGEERYE